MTTPQTASKYSALTFLFPITGLLLISGLLGTGFAQDPAQQDAAIRDAAIEPTLTETAGTFAERSQTDSHQAESPQTETVPDAEQDARTGVELIVLGIAQDAGFPQAGCSKPCCAAAWTEPGVSRMVSCIAVVDHDSGQRWLFDCTPDFPRQLRLLDEMAPVQNDSLRLDGIFLTHAHIGHYTGLIHLGREVMGTSDIPVYTMPRMREFITRNGPWSQLVSLQNIALRELATDVTVQLNDRLSVTPFQVPHRDEFSETVGFRIQGPDRTAVFLPDIDKWGKWSSPIEEVIRSADVAYLDGTFYADGEIPGRDMASIPHPFVTESINRFSVLDDADRSKVRFIHFNHTNPVLRKDSPAASQIERAGMNIAAEGETFHL